MSVQAQWSIDQSSQSVVGIAKGVLQAATTDNVQVLAIVACERFGATLAISPETRLKIEREVLPTPEPAVIGFLKMTVGYNKNDYATQLGRSMAGVQFLALAAALVGTMDSFTAANAIQEMLANTAVDKTLVPTVRQVQDLLDSIEGRCIRTGFANSVFGWRAMLRASSHAYFQELRLNHLTVPHFQGLVNLVDAFRQIHRIGNEDVNGLTIHVSTFGASWTIAFVKWCLGVPPSIVIDDGTPFLPQDESDVTVVICSSESNYGRLDITIHSRIGKPSELVQSSAKIAAVGMIDISIFGQEMLHVNNFDGNMGKRALQEALPLGINQVLKFLLFAQDLPQEAHLAGETSSHREVGKPLSMTQQLNIGSGVSPFPQESAIYRMLSLLFEFPEQNLRCLEDGLGILDVPAVSSYLKQIEQSCICSHCNQENSDHAVRCRQDIFIDHLCSLIAAVLSLSLFERPESLLIWSGNLNGFLNDRIQALKEPIRLILTKRVHARCSPEILAMSSLSYINHHRPGNHNLPLVSYFRGQAAWTTLYETYTISRRGYLSMTWFPGKIMHKHEDYEEVLGSVGSFIDDLSLKYDEEVIQPRNLCSDDLHLQWSVGPLGRGKLSAHLSVTTLPLLIIESRVERFYNTLSRIILMEACRHPPDAALSLADKSATFISPVGKSLVSAGESDSKHVNVVAVDGSDELRFLTLASLPRWPEGYPSVMLRKRACLSCCLNLCREAGIQLLIL